MVVQCDDEGDMMAVLDEGLRNRRSASHDLNKDSSRSHALFTIYVDIESMLQYDALSTPSEAVSRFGKLHLVDLAGSERLKESNSLNDTATETSYINKSLLVLGQVAWALTPRSQPPHPPYPHPCPAQPTSWAWVPSFQLPTPLPLTLGLASSPQKALGHYKGGLSS